MNGDHHYRGYVIRHAPPPIPDRSHDWQWCHEDYDGPHDRRIGTSPTPEQAKRDIDEQIRDFYGPEELEPAR